MGNIFIYKHVVLEEMGSFFAFLLAFFNRKLVNKYKKG